MPQRASIGSPNLKNNHVVRNLARDYQRAQRRASNGLPAALVRDRRVHQPYTIVRGGPAIIGPCRRCQRIGLIDPFLRVCVGVRFNPREAGNVAKDKTLTDLIKLDLTMEPRSKFCKRVGKHRRKRHAWAIQ